jgi:large subunit ribosomal protein L4
MVHWYRSKERKILVKTLSKGQVSGTGKKPFAQKGRGIARQGSLRNPHQRGGGVAFPPSGRIYSYKINKKKKFLAIQSLIAKRLKEKRIKIIQNLKLSKPSTKTILSLLRGLKVKKI